MKKIIGIGEIVWDVLPDGKRIGGAPVNFAYFSNALGAIAYPVSAVGKDALGDEALKALAPSGLDLSYVQRNAMPTGKVLVDMGAEGIPQYEIIENVAWDSIECTPEVVELMKTADVVCWGTLAQRSPKSAESILKIVDSAPESCLKVYDINLRQDFYSKEVVEASLRRADILKINEDELPVVCEMFSLHGDEAAQVKELAGMFSLRNVIYTKGSVCSSVYGMDGSLLSYMPTPKVKVADTVGAGDSFTASFVMSMISGKPLPQSHETAVKVAAFVCTMNGAINPLPEDFAL